MLSVIFSDLLIQKIEAGESQSQFQRAGERLGDIIVKKANKLIRKLILMK